jgi:SpoVK/Ycf46/Vps4 family AAA+-type ATPase
MGTMDGASSFERLLAAARDRADRGLGRLAVKVRLVQGWDDLVLPAGTLTLVRAVAEAIRNQPMVYDEWGFGARSPAGQGIKVLFSGASGTGKTMTAAVIARHLGLDLYKIDLSSVVSKYIGETEKNLDRIFRAAEHSSAILFFDEADALFGKRSEVKDAHDRYANVEVAYLLQKLEAHPGAVILASNLSRNIDEAFLRRMHYTVEFPLPDEALRRRLWQGMFPPEAPVAEDVDLSFLARQFPLAGGDIRNIALDAAFQAAQEATPEGTVDSRHNGQQSSANGCHPAGASIKMKNLVRAIARQYLKQGKLPSTAEFKQHHIWLDPAV